MVLEVCWNDKALKLTELTQAAQQASDPENNGVVSTQNLPLSKLPPSTLFQLRLRAHTNPQSNVVAQNRG